LEGWRRMPAGIHQINAQVHDDISRAGYVTEGIIVSGGYTTKLTINSPRVTQVKLRSVCQQ